MRRRTSMRVRLTLAVGVVTAVFLGLATFLFSERASTLVLDGVKADQQVFSTTELAGAGLVPRAADVYHGLDTTGRLPEFWALLGIPQPAPDVMVVIQGEGPTVPPGGPDGAGPTGVATQGLVVSAGSGSAGEVTLFASTVIELGEPLLGGVSPSNLIVVNNAGAGGAAVGDTAIVGAAVGVPPSGVADAQPVTVIPVENVRSSVAGLGRDLWIATGLLTVLAMAATWLLTGRALRPVEAITRRVDDISAAGSGERVPVPPTNDEIGHLARTVNTMLDRLDRAALTQRRFVADASHELRSPLAVIRAETEVALAHPELTDWPTTTRTVLDETHRLEGLVSDLLVLAQRDDGTKIDRRGTADVDEVVLAEAARHRRVPIDTTGVLAGRVAAHPADVARVVRHLLDNAARHAATTVQVTVRPEDGHVVLMVDDDGAGVPEADRARIFERFARLEDSRSRDAGGAGLGLAVVASVVDGLGGSVVVGTAPLGGARFTVRLPESV